MRVTYGDAFALRPFADVLAIAAAKLIPLAVNMIDDVALFRSSCFDCGRRDFSNFGRSEGRAAFKGAACESYGQSRRPENRKDAYGAYGHQTLSVKPHSRALVHNLRSVGSGGPPGGFRRAFERRACRERS